MSKTPLVAKNGNDCVMTPPVLGRRIVRYFKPKGRMLEPCIGNGKGFFRFMEGADWCEIDKGRDFFDYNKRVRWIITNPPYSKLLKFLEHSFDISDNVVMLILLPAAFHTAKIRLAKLKGFYLKEIIYVPAQPPPFPKFGFQLGVVHYKRGTGDSIKITDWT
jgi:hypothetical protein